MGRIAAYLMAYVLAVLVGTCMMSSAALAQTGTPYKSISDPYANGQLSSDYVPGDATGVSSGTTSAPPDDNIPYGAATKADNRDPAVSGADGKASFPGPMTARPTDDEE